ncbi:hypothetical protein ACWGPZ_29795 [Priestia megaterium]
MVGKYKLFVFAVALTLFIIQGCSKKEPDLHEKYDNEIDEVIQEANRVLPTQKKRQEGSILNRKNTRADIYNDGQFVRLTYKNQDGKWEQSAYKRLEDGSYKLEDPRRFAGKNPLYTENSHIGEGKKHSHEYYGS